MCPCSTLRPHVSGLTPPHKSVPGICVRVRPGVLILDRKSNRGHNLGRWGLAKFCVRVIVRLASGSGDLRPGILVLDPHTRGRHGTNHVLSLN